MRWLLRQCKQGYHWISRQEGMSLIEIIIVLIILGLTIIPLSRLSIQNLNSGGDYITMTRAIFAAQERMEVIVADYSSPSRGYDWVIKNWAGESDTPSKGLTRTVSISGEASFNGVTYVVAQTQVSGSGIQDVILTMWLVDNSE
jgi:prepilin-type N-terminal cleavage/methylation domain-containing protein